MKYKKLSNKEGMLDSFFTCYLLPLICSTYIVTCQRSFSLSWVAKAGIALRP